MAAPLDLWSLMLGQGGATQASSDETLQVSRQHTYVVVLDSTPKATALPQVVRNLLERVTPRLQARQLYDQLGAFSVDLDDNQARRLRAQGGQPKKLGWQQATADGAGGCGHDNVPLELVWSEKLGGRL